MDNHVRIFLSGDCHRTDIDRFEYNFGYIEKELQETENYCFLLGDVGLNWGTKSADNYWKNIYQQMAERYNLTFVCIRGNHEYRPQDRGAQEIEWHGAKAYIDAGFPNIIYAADGAVYTIAGKTFLTIGGAYSVDKYYRLHMHRTWVENEQLDEFERLHIALNLPAKVNYILTHTCPASWQPIHLFLNFVDQDRVDKSMEEWFDSLKNRIEYDEWYWGHFHADWDYNEYAHMLFKSIKEIDV